MRRFLMCEWVILQHCVMIVQCYQLVVNLFCFIVKLMENQTETMALELIDDSLVRSPEGIVLEDT